LRLHRRDAIAEEPLQAGTSQLPQFRSRGFADAPYRGKDPSAAGRDLLIRQAAQALLEFVFAGAGEDQMSMAVDQTGNHYPAGSTDHGRVGGNGRQLYGGTDPANPAVLDYRRAVFDNLRLRVTDQLKGIFDDQHFLARRDNVQEPTLHLQ